MVLYKKHSAAAQDNQPKLFQGNTSVKISTVLGESKYCCCLSKTNELNKS